MFKNVQFSTKEEVKNFSIEPHTYYKISTQVPLHKDYYINPQILKISTYNDSLDMAEEQKKEHLLLNPTYGLKTYLKSCDLSKAQVRQSIGIVNKIVNNIV